PSSTHPLTPTHETRTRIACKPESRTTSRTSAMRGMTVRPTATTSTLKIGDNCSSPRYWDTTPRIRIESPGSSALKALPYAARPAVLSWKKRWSPHSGPVVTVPVVVTTAPGGNARASRTGTCDTSLPISGHRPHSKAIVSRRVANPSKVCDLDVVHPPGGGLSTRSRTYILEADPDRACKA